MSLKVFLELVEFKAKTASVLPFFIGLAYSYYHYHTLHIGLVFIYFVAMFLFNMAVDILDNYNDYHHATDVHDYKHKTNIIGRENLSLKLVFRIMMSLIIVSALMGIGLSMIVGWPLLVMGVYCYLVGIFYSSGPRPLSSLPLGEFFSGFTMGFMISLICVYLNAYDQFVWNFSTIGSIFLISLPSTLWIANLMLANNICDLEEDEKNNRYTIVHYLGKQHALKVFVNMNRLAYLSIVATVALHLAPVMTLLSLVSLPFVWQETQKLLAVQVKSQTFICAVKILAVGSFVHVLSFALGILLQ
ncbi:prenyltransferase [Enterococcus cecorum]|uniref:Prenyltransferase n=1 Tax=Enterococcus cecorum TaxID=44008 RepID=A0AAW8TVU6_9ENTE|nr:prenyltransferase [Enterococcus cecorum]MDT2796975.1 prenyltransferase [Enterococcus cecorum]CAI3315956.1 prenyltransferase [Enterococcus cecorum]CAI3346043.1 prenyltransferase [Enterococcus cecorum]CAI3355143.1 prenyltransferase [Enterococcus cecorum]CAI3359750.1 prenyltransferase [Enterococcus cecorum]